MHALSTVDIHNIAVNLLWLLLLLLCLHKLLLFLSLLQVSHCLQLSISNRSWITSCSCLHRVHIGIADAIRIIVIVIVTIDNRVNRSRSEWFRCFENMLSYRISLDALAEYLSFCIETKQNND